MKAIHFNQGHTPVRGLIVEIQLILIDLSMQMIYIQLLAKICPTCPSRGTLLAINSSQADNILLLSKFKFQKHYSPESKKKPFV